MRKASKRKPRPVSRIITPVQRDALFLAPRMHLELICSGVGTREHIRTIAGLFNITTALAQHAKNQALFANAQGALSILFAAAEKSEPLLLDEEDQVRLKVAFGEAEGYISIQQSSTVLRAVEFIETAIATGEGAHVVRLPASDI